MRFVTKRVLVAFIAVTTIGDHLGCQVGLQLFAKNAILVVALGRQLQWHHHPQPMLGDIVER